MLTPIVLSHDSTTVLQLRLTLWVTGPGVLLSSAWLLLSPLRSTRDLPGDVATQEAVTSGSAVEE
jgi:hypothetical protein